MNRAEKIIELLTTLDEANNYLLIRFCKQTYVESVDMLDDIYELIQCTSDLCEKYYHKSIPKDELFRMIARVKEQPESFIELYRAIAIFIAEFDEKDILYTNDVNSRMEELIALILNYSEETLIEYSKGKLLELKQSNPRRYEDTKNVYNCWKYWGLLDPENGQYELIENRIKMLKTHLDDFIWMFDHLQDYKSKKVLLNILMHWIMFDENNLKAIIDNTFLHYFDLDIIKCGGDEVFVDLGGYIGDTVMDYIYTYGKESYRSIYTYEITPKTFEILKENLKDYDNIIYRTSGVSDKCGFMYLEDSAIDSSAYQLGEKGTIKVPTVTLDEDIKETVTFIKMDIEGAEQSALRGAAQHIKASHPKLAISVYHNNEDIWKIARMVSELDPTYKFYLRYSGGTLYPSEYVLLCV